MEDKVYSEPWKARLLIFWKELGSLRAKKTVIFGYRPDVRAHMFSDHGDYIDFLAREWWTGMMHTHRAARLASITLGITGYSMLAVPSLDIVQAVLRDISSSL